MLDIHSHILPNLDDGSKNIDMTISMLQNSIKEEVDYICATPHFISGEFEITRQNYDKAINVVRQNFSGINILSGLEIYITPDLPQLYKDNKVWGINDSKYILIELPMSEIPIYTQSVFYHLRQEGLIPVLAHPERNLCIIRNIKVLIELINDGIIVQLNSGSLTGFYGRKVKNFSKKLVKMNLVHVLGSDAHNDLDRTTNLKKAYAIIKKLNPDLYQRIIDNQEKIINSSFIDPLPYAKTKKNFFQRLFKF